MSPCAAVELTSGSVTFEVDGSASSLVRKITRCLPSPSGSSQCDMTNEDDVDERAEEMFCFGSGPGASVATRGAGGRVRWQVRIPEHGIGVHTEALDHCSIQKSNEIDLLSVFIVHVNVQAQAYLYH